tara:strand:+ start:77 stop:202 length:126 start_codon:yes stop_codon:yes gene_type:complete
MVRMKQFMRANFFAWAGLVSKIFVATQIPWVTGCEFWGGRM